jgi:hypothetical protein
MEQTKTEISSVTDAVELTAHGSQDFCWYRGQPATAPLVPSLFRPEPPGGPCREAVCNPDNCRRDRCPARGEHLRTEEFMRRSPLLIESPPAEEDHLGWLMWMQHFGVPTRLLDWSESILVALYFAVSDNGYESGTPAVVWCLHPGRFAKHRRLVPKDAIPDSKCGPVKERAVLAFPPAPNEQRPSKPCGRGPVPVLPRMTFTRIGAQLGAFTLHESPTDLADDKEVRKSGLLIGYLIRPGDKARIRHQLERLGITGRTLFPDLQGLGGNLRTHWLT